MKTVKITSVFLLLLISAIIINSFYIQWVTEDIVEELDFSDNYEQAAEKFKKHERYISLTVSHEDLTNIEEAFAELIGAANAGDDAKLVTIKSRLKDSLEHLGRLSGINIDSIL